MSVSLLKRAALKAAPDRAARHLARKMGAKFQFDSNNFGDIGELRTLLQGYDVVSFDLFDTLVWRTIALQDVHRKTAEFADRFVRGDDGPLPTGLLRHCRQRYQQALKLRNMQSEAWFRNEIDLSEVFNGALEPYVRDSNRRAQICEALVQYEIETEGHILEVDEKMVEAIQSLRDMGKTILLISDMYFSSSHLLRLLEKLDLRPFFDHVLVSATIGLTKHSGRLFDYANENLDLENRRILHLGDSWNNDVVQPRMRGWDALHYLNPRNEVRKRELELLSHFNSSRERERNAGCTMPASNEEETLATIAACFSQYSRRVAEIAIQGNFDRIMFLTRDGTVFKGLTQQFLDDAGCAKTLPTPKLEEMAFSRRIGVLLNYPEIGDPHWHRYLIENVQWLANVPLSLRTIMRCFAVRPEELHLPPDPTAWVTNILQDDAPVTDLGFDKLLKRPKLLGALHSALCARRQQARDYINQIGLIDRDQNILLVDIGYSGTTAKALSEYMFQLEHRGVEIASRLSLVLLAANRYYDDNLGRMHPRITVREPILIGTTNWRHRALATNFAWLEPFAVDRTRGSLREYAQDDHGRLVPVFGKGEATKQCGVDHSAILQAARSYEMTRRRSALPDQAMDTTMRQRMIKQFTNPKSSTVEKMKSLSHHGGLTEVQSDSVVSRIRISQLRRDVSAAIREDRWLQGSIRDSGLGFLNPLINRLIGLITR